MTAAPRSTFYDAALSQWQAWTREEELEAGVRLVNARGYDLSAMPQEMLPQLARELRGIMREFTYRNMRLVHMSADKWKRSGEQLDDIIQEGTLGLLRAVELFDPSMGLKFSTYAMWWIRQAITRGVRLSLAAIRRPSHSFEDATKLRRCQNRVTAATGRDATSEELAAMTGKSEVVVERLIAGHEHLATLHLEALSDCDAGRIWEDVIEGKIAPSGEEVVEARQNREMVARLLPAVRRKRDRNVIAGRFGVHELTLQEVGEKMSLGRERVRQVEAISLAAMRARAERLGIQR